MSAHEITRREFLIGTGAAALSLPLLGSSNAPTAAKRPNFVFVLTDDQRWDAMSCAGHPFLKTPNLDRLAKEGVRFTNAFVTTALCSPSRACFLTGRYASSNGIKDNRTPLPDDMLTFPRVLQDAGYDTALVGKWHMDGQEGPRPGFNYWVSFRGQGIYQNPLINVNGDSRRANGYMTDLLTEYAVSWLKQPRGSPFCLYLGHKAVHGPFTPAPRHAKLFSDVRIPRPKTMDDTLEGKPKWVREQWDTMHGINTLKDYDDFVRNYNRTLVAVDEGVGKVLTALSDLGVLDDTVVVFAGDNGYFQGEHGLLDKRAMYEESVRIPLLMRYPRLVRPGTCINRMVLNIDICPTFLDLAGVPIPKEVQGESVRPLLSGHSGGWRSDFLYEYWYEKPYSTPTMHGVRTDRWKYIEYPETNDSAELYDLRNDPAELHNLINDPKSSAVLTDMRARLQRLLAQVR